MKRRNSIPASRMYHGICNFSVNLRYGRVIRVALVLLFFSRQFSPHHFNTIVFSSVWRIRGEKASSKVKRECTEKISTKWTPDAGRRKYTPYMRVN